MKQKEATLRTKQSMAESLKKLAAQKPFAQITVQDIVTDCDINRKTFYYHFKDIYDLLTWTLEQEAIEVVRHYDLLAEYDEALNFVLDYVEENEAFLHSVAQSLGRSEVSRFLFQDIIEIIRIYLDAMQPEEELHVSEDFKNFIAGFVAEAIAGSILDNMGQSANLTRQQFTQYIMVMIDTTIPYTLRAASERHLP